MKTSASFAPYHLLVSVMLARMVWSGSALSLEVTLCLSSLFIKTRKQFSGFSVRSQGGKTINKQTGQPSPKPPWNVPLDSVRPAFSPFASSLTNLTCRALLHPFVFTFVV